MVSTQSTGTSTAGERTGQQDNGQASYINVGTAERWGSIIGGSALALFAAIHGIRDHRISPLGVITTMLGGNLIFRGATGHSYVYQLAGINTARQSTSGPTIFEKVMTIHRPEEDLRDFQQGTDDLETSASTQSPSGTKPTNGQQANEATQQKQLQVWNTLKEAVAKYSGYIQFQKAPDGRGTEIKVVIECGQPPFGKLGAGISMFTGKSPQQQITEDLRHFKEMVEAGEIPSVEGQPTGER
ncbi:MAG TPA: YgaP-like transmembrane domain [Ktedonobacteraceae bacterium]|nr:YgaP-like transmembrane domain [Ktedonobacteraceae bacterium]